MNIAKLTDALQAAMNRAGVTEPVLVSLGTVCDGYREHDGFMVESLDPEVCERAARWIVAFLEKRGAKATSESRIDQRSINRAVAPWICKASKNRGARRLVVTGSFCMSP